MSPRCLWLHWSPLHEKSLYQIRAPWFPTSPTNWSTQTIWQLNFAGSVPFLVACCCWAKCHPSSLGHLRRVWCWDRPCGPLQPRRQSFHFWAGKAHGLLRCWFPWPAQFFKLPIELVLTSSWFFHKMSIRDPCIFSPPAKTQPYPFTSSKPARRHEEETETSA